MIRFYSLSQSTEANMFLMRLIVIHHAYPLISILGVLILLIDCLKSVHHIIVFLFQFLLFCLSNDDSSYLCISNDRNDSVYSFTKRICGREYSRIMSSTSLGNSIFVQAFKYFHQNVSISILSTNRWHCLKKNPL